MLTVKTVGDAEIISYLETLLQKQEQFGGQALINHSQIQIRRALILSVVDLKFKAESSVDEIIKTGLTEGQQ